MQRSAALNRIDFYFYFCVKVVKLLRYNVNPDYQIILLTILGYKFVVFEVLISYTEQIVSLACVNLKSA